MCSSLILAGSVITHSVKCFRTFQLWLLDRCTYLYHLFAKFTCASVSISQQKNIVNCVCLRGVATTSTVPASLMILFVCLFVLSSGGMVKMGDQSLYS